MNSASPASRLVVTAFRWCMALLVVFAVGWAIRSGVEGLNGMGPRIANLRLGLVGLSLLSYLAAMSLSCIFWRVVLAKMNCRPPWPRTVAAFFVSQLGKYVPGKGMVVVLRTDLIRDTATPVVPAASSVFIETLTWLFVGSVISAVATIFLEGVPAALKWTAGSVAIFAGIATWPGVFRHLVVWLTGNRDHSWPELGLKTIATGWMLMAVGWGFSGLSLWLVLRADPELGVGWSDYWLALSCVSLATVAGFASMLPGGLGVRELVMIPFLGPRFGTASAVLAAVLIRLVWISAELLCTAIIYLVRPHFRSAR